MTCAHNSLARKHRGSGTRDSLSAKVRGYEHYDLDVRDTSAVAKLFKSHSGKIDAIVHTASQPSHDWAPRDPQTDFTVNANRTLARRCETIFSRSAVYLYVDK